MIYKKETTSSTMDDAKAAIKSNTAKHGDVFTAKNQTQGRGRRKRAWASPAGNLYYTIILKDVDNPQRLGFYLSLALAELIDGQVKWPNDVLLNGKKTAGILIEAYRDFMVVGIGVNIDHAPTDLPYPATCLKDAGVLITHDDLLLKLTKSILKTLLLPFADVLTEWQERVLFLNEKITVRLPDQDITGVFKGVDADGFLLLETQIGLQKFMIGDVFAG